MKKLALSVFWVFLAFSEITAQSSAQTLDIVSWNLEWYGSASAGPGNDNLQEANAKVIMRNLNADLYGLVEIVDTMRLRRLVDSLGSNYGFVIAPYASNNSTGTGNGWLTAQKLAYVYNKNIFTNVTARGMMRNSGPAYTAFASGRFPYLLNADVTINGTTRNINFILLHGKAGSTPTDYQRRLDGAKELKDTLDAQYSSSINIIIGDYNDALHQTICSACGTTISSYDPIIKDSIDNDHYKSITLPLGVAGQSSMTNFPNVVDNHVISNEAYPFYVPGSASVRTDVASLVSDYGATTSDHYPIFSQYNLSGIPLSIPNITAEVMGVRLYPVPFTHELHLSFTQAQNDVLIQLTDVTGRVLKSKTEKRIQASSVVKMETGELSKGLYYVVLQTKTGRSSVKVVKQ